MFNVVKDELKRKFDIVIMAAAVADYIPILPSKKKIKSNQNNIKITLKKSSKIIDQVKKLQNNVVLVGFKAEVNIAREDLIESAQKKMRESNADIIVANDIGSKYQKNSNNNEVFIIDSDKVVSSGWKKKEKIAKFIRKEIEMRL